jgi:hypothetical protein
MPDGGSTNRGEAAHQENKESRGEWGSPIRRIKAKTWPQNGHYQ